MSPEPDILMTDGPAKGHATLSPSSADRWLSCPASIAMQTKVPRPPESPYATEGTAAHALGELEASLAFDMITEKSYAAALKRWRKEYSITPEIEAEMEVHISDYVALIRERMELHPNSQLLLEQRLPTGVPHCWGTSDTVIVSPEHVEIIDLKYGSGVRVDAEDNSQLKLYGVGALEEIGDVLGTPGIVRMTIFQPRLDHTSTLEMFAAELREWRDSILPIAEEALGDNARFGPSETACRWCPASGRCRAQLEAATSVDFGVDVDVLDPQDLADALEQIPAIKQWLAAIESVSLNTVYSEGGTIPGYKVVLSGGKRFINDAESAIDALSMIGYDKDTVSDRSIKGIGALEKLLGKKEFASILEPYISKTEGKPSLVPESDRRAAVTPNTEAAKVFERDPEEPDDIGGAL